MLTRALIKKLKKEEKKLLGRKKLCRVYIFLYSFVIHIVNTFFFPFKFLVNTLKAHGSMTLILLLLFKHIMDFGRKKRKKKT